MKRAWTLLLGLLVSAGALAAQPVDSALHAPVAALSPAAGGGFWAVLDGPPWEPSFLLVRVSADGAIVEERRLRSHHGSPWAGALTVDAAGRAWVPVSLPPDQPDEPDEPTDGTAAAGSEVPRPRLALRVYDPDGSVAAEAPFEGFFIGLDDDGGALVVQEGGEEPRVLRLDPFTGAAEVALRLRREEFGPASGGCLAYPRSLEPAADGAFYFVDQGSATTLVRRYAAPGVPAGDWHLGRSHGGLFVADSTGDDLYVTTAAGVVRLRPGEPTTAWRLDGWIEALVADPGGAWALLDRRRRVVRLRDDGTVGLVLDLAPPPAGMTYAERDARLATLDRPDEAGAAELVEILLLADGDRAAAARQELLALGVEAVDAVVAAGERWYWPESLARLAVELLAARPVAVGERMAEHPAAGLDAPALWSSQQLPYLLFAHAAAPPPRLRLLAEEHAFGDSLFALAALSAFAGQVEPWVESVPAPGPPGERFPAPPWMVDRYLADLEGSEPPELYDHGAFLLTQFHRAAEAVETRLLDPTHPARPRLVEALAGIPYLMVQRPPGFYGAAEDELARRARRWASSPQPLVAETGALLAVATGDASQVDALLARAVADERLHAADDALMALLARHPPQAEPETAAGLVRRLAVAPPRVAEEPLKAIVRAAPPELLGAAVRSLADPRVPCGSRAALEEALLAAETWKHVPAAALVALVEAGHPVRTPCRDDDFRFLDAAWRRLGERPDLRRRLEERLAAALAATPLRPGNGLPPPWLALLRGGSETALTRLVPQHRLADLTAALLAEPSPEDPGWLPLWFRALGAAAAVRGPWPELTAWLERELTRQPGLVYELPAGAAERWLGAATVEELLADGETTWSRESRERPAGH